MKAFKEKWIRVTESWEKEKERGKKGREGEGESRMDIMVIVLYTTLEVARSRTWKIEACEKSPVRAGEKKKNLEDR